MRAFVSIACTVAVIGFTTAAAAQGKSAGPKVKASSGGVTHQKSAAIKPAGAGKPTAPKASVAHGGRTKTVETKATGRTKTSTATATTGSTTTGGTPVTLTPVQQKLQKNTNLAAKLQGRLPAGTDLNTAAKGFRNLGQFVAAVNVSKNLGLDFPTLKTAMVTDGKSLGQAIQAQKGASVDAGAEATRAQRDADTLIRTSGKTAGKQKTTGHGRP